ncbi:very short patch repair endonuclease [Nonomuraea sp. NPDC051941]|uniref:very short patch repair endonuclease n=1 Tax=Nonomuraea sp. NPDC051941 TaxID=3364373 RepID=UPI0037C61FB4
MGLLTTTPAVSRRMSRQRSRNTQVEVLLRKELHRAGLRFRVHRRPVPGLRREADVVFGPARVAVFVDGCYWHGCPEHATWSKTNADFWRQKINRNRERDRDTDQKLIDVGWLPIRVWEHEDPEEAAKSIVVVVRERRHQSGV